MRPIPFKEAKRIAVIRTDHIGDLIVSSPFLKALRRAAPQAEITAVLPEYTSQVLENTGLTDKILTYSGTPSPDTFAQVRALNADIAVCLAPRTIAYRLTKASGARYRAGYFYSNRPLAALMCRLYYLNRTMSLNLDRSIRNGQPILHEVQQLGEFAKKIGLEYSDDSLYLAFSKAEKQKSEFYKKEWSRPAVILQLHNNWLSCGWTSADLASLTADLIKTAHGGEMIICHGPAEKDLAEALKTALSDHGTKAEHIKFFGNLDFRNWAVLFSSADFVITPDTGAVHLAAALKKTVIAVYEPQTAVLNTQQWAPWQVTHRSLIKGQAQETLKQIISSFEDLLIEHMAYEASDAQQIASEEDHEDMQDTLSGEHPAVLD